MKSKLKLLLTALVITACGSDPEAPGGYAFNDKSLFSSWYNEEYDYTVDLTGLEYNTRTPNFWTRMPVSQSWINTLNSRKIVNPSLDITGITAGTYYDCPFFITIEKSTDFSGYITMEIQNYANTPAYNACLEWDTDTPSLSHHMWNHRYTKVLSGDTYHLEIDYFQAAGDANYGTDTLK